MKRRNVNDLRWSRFENFSASDRANFGLCQHRHKLMQQFVLGGFVIKK
jgi:hypothetical protein